MVGACLFMLAAAGPASACIDRAAPGLLAGADTKSGANDSAHEDLQSNATLPSLRPAISPAWNVMERVEATAVLGAAPFGLSSAACPPLRESDSVFPMRLRSSAKPLGP